MFFAHENLFHRCTFVIRAMETRFASFDLHFADMSIGQTKFRSFLFDYFAQELNEQLFLEIKLRRLLRQCIFNVLFFPPDNYVFYARHSRCLIL